MDLSNGAFSLSEWENLCPDFQFPSQIDQKEKGGQTITTSSLHKQSFGHLPKEDDATFLENVPMSMYPPNPGPWKNNFHHEKLVRELWPSEDMLEALEPTPIRETCNASYSKKPTLNVSPSSTQAFRPISADLTNKQMSTFPPHPAPVTPDHGLYMKQDEQQCLTEASFKSPSLRDPCKVYRTANGTAGANKTKTQETLSNVIESSKTMQARKPKGGSTLRVQPTKNETWTERHRQAKAFDQAHGHCNIPHCSPENQALADWAKRQRYQYTLFKRSRRGDFFGKKSTLTLERIQALNEIRFCWSPHDTAWSDRLAELGEYKKKHGHSNVPAEYKHNKKLACWVKVQRRQFKLWKRVGQSSTMTEKREALLEAMGFKWTAAIGTTRKP